jgi:hypothetical protein
MATLDVFHVALESAGVSSESQISLEQSIELPSVRNVDLLQGRFFSKWGEKYSVGGVSHRICQ